MTALPATRVLEMAGDRLRHLQPWLREWRLDRILRTTPPPAVSAPDLNTEQMVGRFGRTGSIANLRAGAAPSTGQIRLLFPAAATESMGPAYIAILGCAPQGSCLCAVFSRFSVPAVPGELLVDGQEVGLRTLCLWSARQFPAAAVRRSWLVDWMSPAAGRDARMVMDCHHAGFRLPAEVSARTGPAVVAPDDPRHEYIEEMASWVEALSVDTSDTGERDSIGDVDASYEAEGETVARRAAESHAAYGAAGVYGVQGERVTITLWPPITGALGWARAEDEGGFAAGHLEGAVLRSGATAASSEFRNGWAALLLSPPWSAPAVAMPDGSVRLLLR